MLSFSFHKELVKCLYCGRSKIPITQIDQFIPLVVLLLQVQEMQWSEVTGWVALGGAMLGTKRTLPGNRMPQIAAKIKEFGIQGLLIIGGFEVSTECICSTGRVRLA